MTHFEVAIQQNKVFIRRKEDREKCIALSDNDYNLLVEEINAMKNSFDVSFECKGILGCYKLSRSIFIAFIKDVEVIGNGLTGNPVYQVKDIDFVKLPIIGENPVNYRYIEMIQTVLSITNIYYSHHEDLTKRVQDTLSEPLSEENRIWPSTMDSEFMFNYPIIQDFAPFKSLLFKDLIPITIFGFMKIIPFVSIDQKAFSLTLISRRSIYRNGRRFNTRGVDDKGHVANFVETEQIVRTKEGMVFSHVQIRGSIPLEWSQTPYLKYTPKIRIAGNRNLLGVHFDQLVPKYGNIIIVNLIDKKKDQLMIGEEFERGCIQYNNYKNVLNFNWFDFHAECKGMHYENISKLLAMTNESVTNAGFFEMDLKTKTVISKQTAVIRTNCIDCLDRTNVVQSAYAKSVMFTQLFKEKAGEKMKTFFTSNHDIFHVFNNLWSDNADQMSLFYSSSRSLKTDYTRTGKRTQWGAVADGVNSVIRYFNNNFYDGYFEDCLNLTFNRVEMGSRTDQVTKKRSKYTIGRFGAVMLLPLLFLWICCAVFHAKSNRPFYLLAGLYCVVVFYIFVKKGITFGRSFVSKALLPKRQNE